MKKMFITESDLHKIVKESVDKILEMVFDTPQQQQGMQKPKYNVKMNQNLQSKKTQRLPGSYFDMKNTPPAQITQQEAKVLLQDIQRVTENLKNFINSVIKVYEELEKQESGYLDLLIETAIRNTVTKQEIIGEKLTLQDVGMLKVYYDNGDNIMMAKINGSTYFFTVSRFAQGWSMMNQNQKTGAWGGNIPSTVISNYSHERKH